MARDVGKLGQILVGTAELFIESRQLRGTFGDTRFQFQVELLELEFRLVAFVRINRNYLARSQKQKHSDHHCRHEDQQDGGCNVPLLLFA